MKKNTTSKLIAGLLGLASITYAWQVKNPPCRSPFILLLRRIGRK